MPLRFDKFRGEMLSKASRPGFERWLAALLVAGALLWPALYNGFPILFPDTYAYLRVALGHNWTLDRSGFYGLFLKPVSLIDLGAGLWIAIAIQCAIVAAILTAVSFRLVRSFAAVVLTCVALCALTSLPWHAAQLMPDAFTGALVLLAGLLATRDVNEPGMPLLWLGAAVLALLHYTHLVIFPATVVAALIVRALLGGRFSSIARNAVALVACCSAVAAAHVTANGALFGRWEVAPMGSYFLFARLHEDGLAVDWMDRHCGKDASPELCALKDQLPRDSQVLLWGASASPLDGRINQQPGSPESWHWIDRLAQADRGSIREEPLRFAGNVFSAGARQFMHFRALDDECPKQCQFPALTKAKPDLGAQIRSSRQVQDRLPKSLIQNVSTIVSAAGLLLILPILGLAIRRRDMEVASFAAAILAGICVNALVTGGLSDVHDRYQSRVVWLAPLVVLLAIVRWFRRAGAADQDS